MLANRNALSSSGAASAPHSCQNAGDFRPHLPVHHLSELRRHALRQREPLAAACVAESCTTCSAANMPQRHPQRRATRSVCGETTQARGSMSKTLALQINLDYRYRIKSASTTKWLTTSGDLLGANGCTQRHRGYGSASRPCQVRPLPPSGG